MTWKRKGRILTVLVALSLTMLSPSAWARRKGDRTFPGSPQQGQGHQGGVSGGLLEQLLLPCHTTCDSTAYACKATAKEAAVLRIQATCGTEITAARSACQSNEDSPACLTALTNLQTCSQADVATLQAALGTCRTDFTGCVAMCTQHGTP